MQVVGDPRGGLGALVDLLPPAKLQLAGELAVLAAVENPCEYARHGYSMHPV